MRHILTHEAMHVRRRDNLMKLKKVWPQVAKAVAEVSTTTAAAARVITPSLR